MLAPSDREVQLTAKRQSAGRIPARWVPVLRWAWMICALLLLANFLASIPGYYRIMSTICPLPNQADCTSSFGQLTASTMQTLSGWHISLDGYALYFAILDVLVSLLPWGIGLLLFWRKSNEWMGLLVSLLFVFFAGNGVANTFTALWTPDPSSGLVVILLQIISAVQWIGLGAFLLTFPTGRFAPRWSWIIFSLWIFTFLSPTVPAVPAAAYIEGVVGTLVGVVLLGGTLFIVVYRYRRVFDARECQQTKWAVYGIVALVTLIVLGTALSSVLSASSPLQPLFPTLTIMLSSAIVYVSLGFAIFRYRLWDIDTVVNRTLVYGTLTAILALTYAAMILLLQALAQVMNGATADQPLAIVATTLLIIALFNPLRRRLQAFIDRRFYRQKYDAVKILAAFAASLRTEVDLSSLSTHLVHAVEESMQPTHVSLWLRPSDSLRAPGTSRSLMPINRDRGATYEIQEEDIEV